MAEVVVSLPVSRSRIAVSGALTGTTMASNAVAASTALAPTAQRRCRGGIPERQVVWQG